MKAFLALIVQIAFVLFAGILAVQLATESSGSSATRTIKLNVSAESLWTNVPVKVENAQHQQFERLPVPPDPYPLKFRADGRWRALDNNRFSFNGVNYRVMDLSPVERSRICIDAQGRRFACGLNAFKALGNVVRGKFLECRVLPGDDAEKTAECVIDGKSLAQILSRVPGLPPQQNLSASVGGGKP